MTRRADTPADPTVPADPPARAGFAPLLVVALVTILALWPVVTFDFTTWDDNATVTDNANLNPPTLRSLAYHWTHFAGELYVPVTYTAWWPLALVARVDRGDGSFTLNPWIFHAGNLFLHIVAACAMFSVVSRVLNSGTPPDRLRFRNSALPATFGALVFAIHPVQVESVAWVSGLKDVLCGLLVIVALDQHVKHVTTNDRRAAAFATIAFVAALLSKPTAVATPLIVVVIDTLLLKRSVRDATKSALPFVLLAIPIILIGKLAQPAALIDPVPLWTRPFVAGDAVAFYLSKLVFPAKLAIDYGRTPWSVIDSRVAIATSLLAACLIAIAWMLARRRTTRAFAAAILVFIAALAPVLGLVTFEFQSKSTVADHYLYVPMLGVSLAVASAVARMKRWLVVPLAVILLIALGTRTWFATWPWRGSATLFNHALMINPNSVAAENNLIQLAIDTDPPANVLARAKAFRARAPNAPEAQFVFAHALALNHRYEEAAIAYRRAADRWPDRIEGYLGLAATMIDLGRPTEALAAYDRALQVAPDNAAVRQLRERVAASTAPSTQ